MVPLNLVLIPTFGGGTFKNCTKWSNVNFLQNGDLRLLLRENDHSSVNSHPILVIIDDLDIPWLPLHDAAVGYVVNDDFNIEFQI